MQSTMMRYFNPHSRKGSDYGGVSEFDRIHISIHTPARGVTLNAISDLGLAVISIHTPARGVTHTAFPAQDFVGYFNPHSRKGSDSAA